MRRWIPAILGYVIVFSMFCWQAQHRHKTPVRADGITNAQVLYDHYNAWWFNDNLPKTIHVEWDDHNKDEMAVTTGTYAAPEAIHLNRQYITAGKTEDWIMFHEMCHIENWQASMVEARQGKDVHIKVWNDCMHRLADQKAMEGFW